MILTLALTLFVGLDLFCAEPPPLAVVMEPEGSLLDSDALRLREDEGVAMVAKATGAGAAAAAVVVEIFVEFLEPPTLLLVVG